MREPPLAEEGNLQEPPYRWGQSAGALFNKSGCDQAHAIANFIN